MKGRQVIAPKCSIEARQEELIMAMFTYDTNVVRRVINKHKLPVLYIAGKISGMEAEAKVLFAAAEITLSKRGYLVVNPMKLPHEHDKKWSSYMRECIKALMLCESIYLLPNWLDSKGALIEFEISKMLGIQPYFETSKFN